MPLRLRQCGERVLGQRATGEDEELRVLASGKERAMLVKFITAAAWLWGGFGAFATLVQFIPPVKVEDFERACRNFLISLPALAWLLARYVL